MATGRPSKYKPAFAKQAAKLCKMGATDKELADFFEVSEVTINAWKAKYSDFLKSLKAGKGEADDRVERSLYQRAVGYSHPDTHISNYQGEITVTDIVKHYPPDTTAGIFWLKNRRREDWRDKHDHEHTGTVQHEVTDAASVKSDIEEQFAESTDEAAGGSTLVH